MIHRILIFSSVLLQCTFIHCMDTANQPSTKIKEGEITVTLMQSYQKTVRDARTQSRQAAIAYFKYLSTIDETFKKKDLLTPIKPIKDSSIDFNKSLESNYSFAQGNELENYKKEKETLNTQSQTLFNNFLSKTSCASLLILHPDSFALRETLIKLKEIIETTEKELNEKHRTRLFLDDLLLSIEINSLNFTLEATKKSTESK